MGNEYGWNNRNDYSDNALNAFRLWCERKYGTIGALNQAWGTTFWGQEMNSFDEVLIPRFMGADSMVNPGQKLDFERFGNDMLPTSTRPNATRSPKSAPTSRSPRISWSPPTSAAWITLTGPTK